MIISNSGKFIFVHIMKTGGTSVTKSLEPLLRWDDLVVGNFGGKVKADRCPRLSPGKHGTAMEIREALGNDLWNDYFSFALVRHPFQRAVSTYFYIERIVRSKGAGRYLHRLPLRRYSSDVFWQWPATRAYLEGRNLAGFLRLANEYGAKGMRPQMNWLLDENGNVMVDHIGRVEKMEAEMEFLTGKFGLPDLKTKNSNRSHSQPWRELLTKADKEFLFGVFRKDFELLGYDPEL